MPGISGRFSLFGFVGVVKDRRVGCWIFDVAAKEKVAGRLTWIVHNVNRFVWEGFCLVAEEFCGVQFAGCSSMRRIVIRQLHERCRAKNSYAQRGKKHDSTKSDRHLFSVGKLGETIVETPKITCHSTLISLEQ
jgi:hypothetical protein